MDTAGKIEVNVPAVVSPSGEVSAACIVSKNDQGQLEDVTDVGVLYDHWYGQEDIPLALVRIKAEIDLDEVFAAREVEGTVETIKHGRDE